MSSVPPKLFKSSSGTDCCDSPLFFHKNEESIFFIKMFTRYLFLLLEKRGWASKKSALYGEGDCSQWLWLLVAKIPTGSEAFFQMFSINAMKAPVPAHRQTRLKAESDEWVLLNEGLYVCSDPSHLLTGCWVWYQKHPCVSCTFIPSWSCLIVLKINNNDINDFPKNTH